MRCLGAQIKFTTGGKLHIKCTISSPSHALSTTVIMCYSIIVSFPGKLGDCCSISILYPQGVLCVLHHPPWCLFSFSCYLPWVFYLYFLVRGDYIHPRRTLCVCKDSKLKIVDDVHCKIKHFTMYTSFPPLKNLKKIYIKRTQWKTFAEFTCLHTQNFRVTAIMEMASQGRTYPGKMMCKSCTNCLVFWFQHSFHSANNNVLSPS